jgi:hypothetical protein
MKGGVVFNRAIKTLTDKPKTEEKQKYLLKIKRI